MQNLTTPSPPLLSSQSAESRANSIGPGATITPINRGWVDDPVKAEMVTRHIPMRDVPAAPMRLRESHAFLQATTPQYITGQTIFVDGGLTLYADFREPWSSE